MRRLFDQLQRDVEAFVEQRDDLLLVVPCTDADAPLVAQVVGDAEQANGTDAFLVFPDPFVEASPYVDVVVERLREQVTLANQALEEEGRPPFPPLPDALRDARRPPGDRLKEAIGFARALVPSDGGHRLVWALVPLEVHDHDGFLRLLATLVPWHGVESWMRGVRLLVRDAPATAAVARRYAEAPRLRVRPVDAGPDALAGALRDDAADEALPDDQRMSAYLQLALLDYAHNRPQDAFAKLEVLLGYYQHTGDPGMQALVMNTFGDVYHRNDQLGDARHWYECALVPLAEAPAPVVLFTVLKNLGRVCFAQGDAAVAEQYFAMMEEVATQRNDAEGKAEALEWQGLSREKRGAYAEAVDSWKAGAELSRGVEMDAPLAAALGHLARLYEQGRRDAALAEVRAELASLEAAS